MDITPSKRSRIVTLSECAGMSVRKIAEEYGVHYSTVSRIRKAHQETGSFSPRRKGKCGRKRKTTKRDDRNLLRKSLKTLNLLVMIFKRN